MTMAWGRRQHTGAAQAGDVRAGPKVSTFFCQFCVELRFSQRLGNELKGCFCGSAGICKDAVLAKMIEDVCIALKHS